MAPGKKATGKDAAKYAKKEKQASKAAKKEAALIKSKGGKSKGKDVNNDDEDLDAILDRYKAEMEAVSGPLRIALTTARGKHGHHPREPPFAADGGIIPPFTGDSVIGEQPFVPTLWRVL